MSDGHTAALSEASYGKSLSKAEPYSTEEIPDSERHGHPFQQFTLWFAANMVLAVLVSGFFSALFGLSVAQGLSAVAVGSLAGALVMGLLAGIGTKFGVPQQIQARGPMGYFGNFVPIALLTVVSAIGWCAVNTVFAVLALQTLIGMPSWVGAAVIFGVQALCAAWGYNLIHLMNKIASVVLTILFAIITVLSLGQADFGAGVNPDAPLYVGEAAGWVTFAGFFFAYVMTWTPFASDFSRYLPRSTSHTRVLAYTAGGSFVAMMWLGGIGVLVSSFAGERGAIEVLDEMTGSFAPVAMATVVLSTLPVSAMNLYGGSLSLLTIRIPVGRRAGVAIVAAIGLGVTLWMQKDPYGSFYDFLLLLAYLVVPFSTVLLLDYYLRMRARPADAVAELFDPRRVVEWGFVAWIFGCVVSALFWNTSLVVGPFAASVAGAGDIAYYIGAVAAVVAYLALRRLPALSALLGARSAPVPVSAAADDTRPLSASRQPGHGETEKSS